MHTCCTWLLLYATPTHLPSICPFTHPYVLISALSIIMYLPPALWAWIRAPATHFLGAQILITSTTSSPPAALSALPQHLPPPFSVIVLSSEYLLAFNGALSGFTAEKLNSCKASSHDMTTEHVRPAGKGYFSPGEEGGGHSATEGGAPALSKLKNTPKALISDQKSTLISIKTLTFSSK